MRRRLRRSRQVMETELAPLTDLMTGAVGIVLFSLILAVINARRTTFTWKQDATAAASASGVAAPRDDFSKIAVDTDKNVFIFTCFENKITAVDVPKLQAGFHLDLHTLWDFKLLLDQINDEHVVEVGRAKAIMVGDWEGGWGWVRVTWLQLRAFPNGEGEGPEAIDDPASDFRRAISEANPEKVWLNFHVDSASVDLFQAAREVARARGFQVGWVPRTDGWPLYLNLLGGGGFQLRPQEATSSGG